MEIWFYQEKVGIVKTDTKAFNHKNDYRAFFK